VAILYSVYFLGKIACKRTVEGGAEIRIVEMGGVVGRYAGQKEGEGELPKENSGHDLGKHQRTVAAFG